MSAPKLFRAGFTQLVSVIPPGAPLAPSSRIPSTQLGKVPGRKNSSGTWGGYDWLRYTPTEEELAAWSRDGANLGLLSSRYPALDIDTLNPQLAEEIETLALELLGRAPVRFGRAPKRLLQYRTDQPFPRMAIIIRQDGVEHLIEMLGEGRQHLVEGTHPSGSQYRWCIPLGEGRYNVLTRGLESVQAGSLTTVTREQVQAFFAALAELYPDTTIVSATEAGSRTPQTGLLAPSLDALRECLAAIPNTATLIPGRAEYIQLGEAVHAACGDDEEGGFELWAEWCGRHEREDHRGTIEGWREDWRRFRGPHAIGWSWLADLAAAYTPAFHRGAWEFQADPAAAADTVRESEEQPPELSDAWLADQVVTESGHLLRYLADLGRWYCWDGSHWARDGLQLADYHIDRVLRRMADVVSRRGATDSAKKKSLDQAMRLCSAAKHRDVRTLVRHDPRIAALPMVFDTDPWLLNTPAGTVNLRTGELMPPNSELLCSRQTAVAPAFGTAAPIWSQFLREVTEGDVELEAYLRRLIGYALTGLTTEQVLAFVYGPTMTGKGTFLHAIAAMLGDYAVDAPMNTFTASTYDRHPTELAGLMGARLVTASETQEGRHWDEQRVKLLTGGDPITARFMRQDFVTFVGQFLLMFAGNFRPQITNLDDAMRRRIHLVPFLHQPAVRNNALAEQLRAEYPMILAWAIRGCLEWQQQGLQPPASVVAATEEYFTDEDPVGRWIEECCTQRPEHRETTTALFNSWLEWAHRNGEQASTQKHFAQLLIVRQLPRWRDNSGRGFLGLQLNPTNLQEAVP